MSRGRVQMLKTIVSWRDVSDVDLAHCGMDSPVPSNDEVIFPRNAIKCLFNHYYRMNEDVEIGHFAESIEAYATTDSYYCLFYGRELGRIVTWLERKHRGAEARGFLEHCLVSLGVLKSTSSLFAIDHFAEGNYSHSWPVILLNRYVQLLAKQGATEQAKTLIAESLDSGGLCDDAAIMLEKTLESLEKRRRHSKVPVKRVGRSQFSADQLAEPTIESVALAYLRHDLGKDGVVAGVDLWRVLPQLMQTDLSPEAFRSICLEAADTVVPPAFQSFLLANRARLLTGLSATVGATFGAVGYPDLILWDASDLSDLVLVEVKGAHDRLQPHQEAVLSRLLEAGVPCLVLRITQQ